MRIHNTLGRELVEFRPREPGKVTMYVCGPTVQAAPHLGHGRAFVVFEMVRRYLTWKGFHVTYVRNVTDIDDKIIRIAAERGVSFDVHAREIESRFGETMAALGAEPPDLEPRATDHIPEIIALIEQLVAAGHAYVADGDVYFGVRSYPEYGKLSGRNVDDLLAGARVDPGDKKADPLDFALWKAAKPDEPSWESPWGEGRPGWHIECSAMARTYLGEGFDIHGGGDDLIFPHHENEIAQSEAATGVPFASYWMHNGMLNLGGEKMAKSTGHVIGLRQAVTDYPAPALWLFYLRAHYRSQLEHSLQLLDEAVASHARLDAFRRRVAGAGDHPDAVFLARFTAAMDDDFNTPEAIGVLFDLVREGNRRLDAGEDASDLAATFDVIAGILGFERGARTSSAAWPRLADLAAREGVAGEEAGDVVDGLIAARAAARANRDWERADAIRDDLAAAGVVLEDTPDGVRWYRS